MADREQLLKKRELLLRQRELLARKEQLFTPSFPSSEKMFTTTNQTLSRIPGLDSENRSMFVSARKKLDASTYLSEVTGVDVDAIRGNYEVYSIAHGYGGNHEADWEHISGHLRRKKQIREQRAEALKDINFSDRAKNALGKVASGLTGAAAGSADWISITAYQLEQKFPNWTKSMDDAFGREKTESADDLFFAQFAKFMREKSEELAPTNPALQEEFWSSKVPEAFGAMMGFVAGGGVGKKILKSTVTPVLAMGMTSQGASGYRDAIENGATERQALYSYLLNTGLGASEVIPISRMLRRFGAPGGKKALSVLRNTGIEGLEEFVQEAGQSAASNAIAQALYDEDRGYWDGVFESGAAGGVTGILASFLVSALPGKQNISIENTGNANINEEIPSEQVWTLTREQMSDEQIIEKYGETGLEAANGDLDAQQRYQESLVPDAEAVNDDLQRQAEEASREVPDSLPSQDTTTAPPEGIKAVPDADLAKFISEEDTALTTPLLDEALGFTPGKAEPSNIVEVNGKIEINGKEADPIPATDTTDTERALYKKEFELANDHFKTELKEDKSFTSAERDYFNALMEEQTSIELDKYGIERVKDKDLAPLKKKAEESREGMLQVAEINKRVKDAVAKTKLQGEIAVLRERAKGEKAAQEAEKLFKPSQAHVEDVTASDTTPTTLKEIESLKQPLLGEEQLRDVEELILQEESDIVQRDVEGRADDKSPEQKRKIRSAITLAKEVQKRAKLIQKNFNDKKNLQESIGQLVDLAKAMPRSIRGDIIPKFKQLSLKVSPEAQQKVLDSAVDLAVKRVDKFLAIESRGKLQKQTKPLVKQIKQALSAKKGPNKELQATKEYLEERGLFDPTIRNAIDKEFVALEQKISNSEDQFNLTDEDVELARKAMLPDLRRSDLSSAEYVQALADIKHLVKEGTTVYEARRDIEKKKISAQVGLIINEVVSRLSAKGKDALNPEEIQEFQGNISLLNSAKFALLDYRSVSTLLTGKRTDSRIKTFIFDQISSAMSESLVQHDSYVRFIKDLEKRFNIDTGNIAAQDFMRIGNKTISYTQGMFIYGHSQNLAGRRHLANTTVGGLKLKGDQLSRVIEALPENQKKFVDSIIDYNDLVMYPRLNTLFREAYGVDMPRVERYLPLTNLNGVTSFDSIFEEAFRVATTASSFLKGRTGSKAGFKSLDFIPMLYRHNRAAEHTIAMRKTITRVQQVLSDKKLQDKINSVDRKALAWFRGYLEDVARGKMAPPNSDVIAVIRLLRNNVRTFFVALNPASWLKTQSPIISATQDTGKGAMLSSLANPFAGVSNWKIASENSKFMATRAPTARIEMMEIAESRDYFSGKSPSKAVGKISRQAALLMTRAQESAYWVYTPLDKASTSAVWVAKYRSELSKHGDQQLAVKNADEVVKVHFPSGRVDELPALFRSGGLDKELTIFTADMNRMFNLGFTKAQMNDRRIQEGIVFAVYSVLLSSLYLAATDVPWDWARELMGTREEEEDRKGQYFKDAARYASSQVVGGIPVVGSGVEAGVAKLTGDANMSEMIARQTPIHAYPVQLAVRGEYVSAASALTGIPGGNIISKLVDEYLEDED
tara:strand:+ start:1699 stop:6471 length:4773 start_codon:yes stop_codon:yes gene_type:complete